MTPGELGELQKKEEYRIEASQEGYRKGQLDIEIKDYHVVHRGLAIEFKIPKGTGALHLSIFASMRFSLRKASVIIENGSQKCYYFFGPHLWSSSVGVDFSLICHTHE